MEKNNLVARPRDGGQAFRSVSRCYDVGVVCAVLMAHAPILIPEVGGEDGDAASASCRAMRAAATCVVNHRPEALVLVSPHSPRRSQAFGVWDIDPLQGSFAPFKAPHARVSLPLDRALAQAIASEALALDVQTWAIPRAPLDHGALVPLWFLAEAGWAGPTVVLGLDASGDGNLVGLGEAIASAARAMSRRVAVVASGDMSHRLTAHAPCGYHPQAHEFDETFLRLIRAGEFRKLETIDPALRALAAEDAVESTLIAASSVHWKASGHRVLHYEGPFGVGYGVALLHTETADLPNTGLPEGEAEQSGGAELPGLARRSVEAALRKGSERPPPPTGTYLGARRGLFVTIRQKNGRLRGCVGTIVPASPNIVEETWHNARLAALKDIRFPPVHADELAGLRFEVSVLHAPEEVASEKALDPGSYGVIVTAQDGRRGLLLPGIREIQTVEEQIRYAREKGGIGPDESITLQRFQVDHYQEPDE